MGLSPNALRAYKAEILQIFLAYYGGFVAADVTGRILKFDDFLSMLELVRPGAYEYVDITDFEQWLREGRQMFNVG